MGAAAAKAVEDFAAARETQAEHRLAIAEHVILEWHRARSSGADVGIWDADATCTNKTLLTAVDELVLLAEIHAFPMVSATRRCMDNALGVAMSCLMEEFLRLRVWDASQLEGRSGLRFAVEKLSVSAADCGVSLAFPTDGSNSTAGTTAELSLSELYASGGSESIGPDVVTVSLDGKFLDQLGLICPASLSVLHEIALRVIRAGYTNELRHTFTNAPCDVLDRFMSILQLECSLETDQINFEDAEWWTTEDMIKRWILTTKLVGKALVVMQRQLHAQSCGAFDRFKDEYFSAIAKQNIFTLLKFADGFTSTQSPEKLIYVLEMYEALSKAVPGLLHLFTGQHMELISRQVGVILTKLARALRIMIGGLITKIRTDCSQTHSVAHNVGVHPLTRYVMNCIELLSPHRDSLDLILANGGRGAPVGGTESVTSLGSLVLELITCLRRNLDDKSALCGAEGLRQLFLANNASFVLKLVVDADVKSLLGDEWAARHQSRIEQHIASYLGASWAPVVACLETVGRKPVKVVTKFSFAFEKAYSSEVCCEVPDPALRAALRMAVSEMVVPVYNAYLRKHPKLGKTVKYTADKLAELLSELFEGEATESWKA